MECSQPRRFQKATFYWSTLGSTSQKKRHVTEKRSTKLAVDVSCTSSRIMAKMNGKICFTMILMLLLKKYFIIITVYIEFIRKDSKTVMFLLAVLLPLF